MRVLGAILAGGRSTRFGSDKALARIDGRCLLDHAAEALRAQTEALIVCGREWPDAASIADRPAAGLGPLGGLNAALHHAQAKAYDAVLCVPVDVYPLPGTLRAMLEGDGPRVLAAQWSIGFWPASLRAALDRQLTEGHLSFRSWIAATGAASVDDSDLGLVNLNRVEDCSGVHQRTAKP
jgi:molybdenum cofactor guanylyltransferase